MTTYRVVCAHAGACTHAILQLEFVHVWLSVCFSVYVFAESKSERVDSLVNERAQLEL